MSSSTPSRPHGARLDLVIGVVTILLFIFAARVAAQRSVDASVIHVVTALLPPQMGADGQGREAEIIRRALRAGGIGRQIEFHVVPFTRQWELFRSDSRFDMVTTVPVEIQLDGLQSSPYINYQNGIIYKDADFPGGLGDSPFARLNGRRVVTFAGASSILDDVRQLVSNASMYIERANQASHSMMFVNGLVDVVIADELIFANYTNDLLGAGYGAFMANVRFDPVFCPTPYHAVFRDESLRNAFEEGLKVIKANGTVAAIDQTFRRRYAINGTARRKSGC